MWKFTLGFLFLSQCVFGQMTKDSVLVILEEKCNACHRDEKKETIFSLENMDMFARKINRQVFIFKTMPKGDELILTAAEKIALKDWIQSVKRKK